jgi:hypothetical protein
MHLVNPAILNHEFGIRYLYIIVSFVMVFLEHIFEKFALHSNEKLRVFATEAFRSEKSTETSNYSTEVSIETHETFESISRSPKFYFC